MGEIGPKFGQILVGDEDDLEKLWKKIRTLSVPMVNDPQRLEGKFLKSGNMGHPSFYVVLVCSGFEIQDSGFAKSMFQTSE